VTDNLPALQPVGPAESQGTVIEQARAVAQVVAMVQAARQCPRNPDYAVAQMREARDQLAVAERAFYKFPKGGKSVTGPTVHLMDQLARTWQNIDHGMAELRRDITGGFSEAKVWAWDMEANYRVEQSFIVPHKRDTKDGPADLKELRDVYELVTNQSRRRVRESIRRVLPAWFVEEAIDRCNETLRTGGKGPRRRSRCRRARRVPRVSPPRRRTRSSPSAHSARTASGAWRARNSSP
jgi:hypothetical protein